VKRSDLQCFWAKKCVKDGNLGFPDADSLPKLSKDNQDVPQFFRILACTQCTRWVCALYTASELAVGCTFAANSL